MTVGKLHKLPRKKLRNIKVSGLFSQYNMTCLSRRVCEARLGTIKSSFEDKTLIGNSVLLVNQINFDSLAYSTTVLL